MVKALDSAVEFVGKQENDVIAVTELGYIGFNVTDRVAWENYARSLGLEVFEEDDSARFYIRMDYWHHRFVMNVADHDDLAFVGWRVSDAAALEAIHRQITEAGYAVRVASAQEAADRHVLGLLKLNDPTGVPTEIFFGPRVDRHKPFHPGRPMHGRFLTGEHGLGHIVIKSDDVIDSHKFYTALGLTGSVEYFLQSPAGMLQPVFMHCNNRQHSVAFGVPSDKLINHMMLEYESLDDLGLAHDFVRNEKIPVALQLGKHSNDLGLTFYSATPSGWLMELGWGGERPPAQQQYHMRDVFGHGIESAGIGLDVEI